MRDRYRFLLTTLFLCNVFLCELAIANPLYVPQYLSGGTGRNIRHLPCVSRRTGETGVCMFAFTCAKANGTHLGTCIDRFYFGSCCKIDDELNVSPQDNAIDDGPLHTKPSIITTPNAIESNDIPEYIPKPKPFLEDKPSVSITTRIPASSTQKITTKKPITTTVEIPSKITTFQTVQTVAQGRPTTPEPIGTTVKPTVSHRPISSSSTHRPSTVPQTITYMTTDRTSVASSSVFSQTSESTTEKIAETTKKSSVSATVPPKTTPFTRFPPRNSTTARPATTITKRPSTVATKKPTITVPKPQRPSSTSKRPATSTKKPSSVISTTKRPTTNKKTTTKRPPTTLALTRPSSPKPSATSGNLPATQSIDSATKVPTKKPANKVTTTTEKISTTVKTKPTSAAGTKKPPPTKRPVNETSTKVTARPTSTRPAPSATSVLYEVPTTNQLSTASTTKVTTSKPSTSLASTLLVTSPSSLLPSSSISSSSASSSSPSTVPHTSPSLSTAPIYSTILQNLTSINEVVPSKDSTPGHQTSVGLVTWTSNSDELVTTKVPEITSTTQAPTTTAKWSSATTSPEWIFIPSPTTEKAGVTESASSPIVTFSDRPTTPAKPELDKVTTESTTKKTTVKTTPPPTTSSTTVSTTTSHMMDYTQVCGRRLYPEPRIVGGDRSSFGKWPWQISLRQWKNYYAHKCGAALLNENWAITAAHCVQGVPKEDILLRMGETDTTDKDEPYGYIERRVHLVVPHQQFDPVTYEYDLALLRFDQPILPFQPNVLPVCVPDDDESYTGQMAYVTGWGRLRHEDSTEPLPTVLQEVAVPVLNNTICEAMYRSAGYIEHIPYIFICAGWRKGGHDSCEGDSGGPMVIQRPRDKRWVLAGIISWGIGCAAPNQPGVYTRISEFRDWINQILPF